MIIEIISIRPRKGVILGLLLAFIATTTLAAEISNISCRPRKGDRQYCTFLLDGEAWTHGAVPAGLDPSAFLTGKADTMLVDRYHATYPEAVIKAKKDETEIDAWKRAIRDGRDDSGNPLKKQE